MSGNLYKSAILILAFLAIFAIEWLTPIHSDDYRYFLLGISPEAHIHHYLTWSGRIIADYASSLILVSQSQFVYSFSTAAAVLAFCYFIAKTPAKTLRWAKSDNILVPLIFFTYWISNPNLGQTTFWLVGAANYLWTNLFVAAWVFYIYQITADNIKKISPLVIVLSFMAGCSNESVSPFVFLLALLAMAYELWMTKTVSKNKAIYTLFTLIGSCTLILSPGNFVRASDKAFWYGKPLLERIAIHVTERVHNHLALIWICYVVLFLLVLLVIFNKNLRSKIDKKYIAPAILMIVIGIGTVLIMFASPSYPDRVVNGTFMFFLFAISFIAYSILISGIKKGVIGVTAITILCAGTFLWSYTLMYKSYVRVALQEQVRLSIIKKEVSQGNLDFTIPDYHFVKMQNSGGQFGLFHDPAVYGEYYSVNNIFRKTVGFDYSVIANGKVINLSDGKSAYANSTGDFIIISQQPVNKPITVKVNNTERTLQVDKMKSVKINHDYWYYSHIPDGTVANVSL
ncbi:DUF6056 family protein [Kosakonia sp. H02]|nr:DUF6056 family protein [Kosakonia sp. H02]